MNMEGYTSRELADILGINLKAVKLRIFREGIKPLQKMPYMKSQSLKY
jgi:DNA-directed RNA polymerase specialized sigma24 family protein